MLYVTQSITSTLRNQALSFTSRLPLQPSLVKPEIRVTSLLNMASVRKFPPSVHCVRLLSFRRQTKALSNHLHHLATTPARCNSFRTSLHAHCVVTRINHTSHDPHHVCSTSTAVWHRQIIHRPPLHSSRRPPHPACPTDAPSLKPSMCSSVKTTTNNFSLCTTKSLSNALDSSARRGIRAETQTSHYRLICTTSTRTYSTCICTASTSKRSRNFQSSKMSMRTTVIPNCA